jgi:hypothetical protein
MSQSFSFMELDRLAQLAEQLSHIQQIPDHFPPANRGSWSELGSRWHGDEERYAHSGAGAAGTP